MFVIYYFGKKNVIDYGFLNPLYKPEFSACANKILTHWNPNEMDTIL